MSQGEASRVHITGKNVDITRDMTRYIEEKLSLFAGILDQDPCVNVILETRRESCCTLKLKIRHTKIKVSAVSDNLLLAIDTAANKIKTILLRYKEKIQEYHKKERPIYDMKVHVVQKPDECTEWEEMVEIQPLANAQNPQVIGSERKALMHLDIDEAVVLMELSSDLFLVFRALNDNRLKVLYRRSDGNYGLLQPE